MTEAAIGVFDSGVGGLSVLQEIRVTLPSEDLLYVADSGAAPYGDRSELFIKDRVLTIADYFMNQRVKAIVVACNTATAVAVQTVRTRFSIPIIAMEPAVKPAVKLTKTGVIGVLATSRTLASERFAQLAGHYGQSVQVIVQPCPGFVEQVEKGDLTSPETLDLVRRYVTPLLERGADTLVLGCTHYPFLRPAIGRITGPGVHVIDSSGAVARQVHRRLEADGLLTTRQTAGTELFWTTGTPRRVQPVMSALWGREVGVQGFSLTTSSSSSSMSL